MISIEDDGAGLSRNGIFEKAVERGLIPADSKMRDEEVYKLIFHSGFSTAQSVSNVSGRGVGMDVVKKEMDTLGGHIGLDSKEGEYTKVNITLPLTLAIIDGLLVSIQDDHYVLPLSAVESCLEMDDVIQKQKDTTSEGDIIYYREQFLPYINLRSFLNYPGNPPEREQLVVIRTEDSFYGLVVDQVLGVHQSLILNIATMAKMASKKVISQEVDN
jgi:two-component system chemotaxis sensor kinase CheA